MAGIKSGIIKIPLTYFLFTALLALVAFSCQPDSGDRPNEVVQGVIPYNQIPFDSVRLMSLLALEKNRNTYSKNTFQLIPYKKVEFKIEDSTSVNYSFDPLYYDGGDDQFFFNFDEELNKTNIYSFNSGKLVKKLTTRDIPNTKWYFRRLCVVNMDSIFVYANNNLDLLLMDSSGAIKNIWPLEDYFNTYVGPTLYSRLFVNNNKMYLKYWLPNDSARTSDRAYFDSSTTVCFDLKTGAISFLGATYIRANTEQFHYQTRHMVNEGHNGTLVTRFATLPLVFETQPDNNETKVYYVRSKYQREPIGYAPKDDFGDILPNPEYYLLQNYESVFYDKYRKVYYSIYSHETPVKDPKTGLINTFDQIPVSIIICDTNFNIMGETLLEPNTYFRNYLVTKEGLMISNANGNNPDLNPKVLSFTILKLEEISPL